MYLFFYFDSIGAAHQEISFVLELLGFIADIKELSQILTDTPLS